MTTGSPDGRGVRAKMRTTRRDIKLLLVALSLAATLGEWAILAREETRPAAPPPAPKAVTRAATLPPVPTVVPPPVLDPPMSAQPGAIATLDLPPIPELPSIPQARIAAPSRRGPHPVTRTRSSR